MAEGIDRLAAGGVLAAACVSALVVNANTSAVTIPTGPTAAASRNSCERSRHAD